MMTTPTLSRLAALLTPLALLSAARAGDESALHDLPALWTADGVGAVDRISPTNVQHLGIRNIDDVDVLDHREFTAELEFTWEHFESDDSAEQEIELEIEYGITSWLSAKLTIPDVWAGPDSKEQESGFDDMGLEFKTLLFRFDKLDIGTVTEITFPTGSSSIGAGEDYVAENKLAISYYPCDTLGFHANAGLIHQEGDFFARHIFSLACHKVFSECFELQSEYKVEGDSDEFDAEVDYHLVLNYITSETWAFQLALRGEIEDDEHSLELGPGFKSEFPLGDHLELEFNLGTFVGLTNETEDWGLRAQLAIGY